MASSLFGNNQGGPMSDPQSFVNSLRQMVGGNPDAAMASMMRTNPQFADFVQRNRNKTPEQIAADYGIDLGPMRKFL